MVRIARFVLLASLGVSIAAQAYARAYVFQAVRNNDLAALRTAVAEKADLEARGPRDVTLLMHAAAFGSLQSVKILLDAGADPNAKDGFGATALVWAAGEAAKAKLLVECGADVNVTTRQGRTPLIVAAAHDGNTRTVKLLLDKGADIKAMDSMGDTALTVATFANELDTVKLLLERGARPDETNKAGYTALLHAASNGNTAMIRLLLGKGANVNAANVFGGEVKFGQIALKQLTPLMLAAPHGGPAVVRLLLEAGAEVNTRDSRGMTPLMLAVASDDENLEVIEMLIERGAEVNARSQDGETALDWAQKFRNPRVITRLEKAGAKIVAAERRFPIARNAGSDVREAVERSVRLLQTSGAEFFRQSGCVACHNQPAVLAASAAARSAGIAVDETAAAEAAKQIISFWDLFGPGLLERVDGPAPPDIQVAALLGLAAAKQTPGPVTDMVAVNVAAVQRRDGSWKLEGFSRAPSEESHIARTVASLRTLQVYAPPGRKGEFEARVDKARKWIEKATPKTTDDFVWRLAGLFWTGAHSSKVAQASGALRKLQRVDGGFAPNAYLESDAYATATALWALHTAGAVSANDAIYRRGIAYLLRTQQEDGSWHVRSRAPKFQPYFESGFPHGHDQWISSSATAWATVALAPSVGRSISEIRGVAPSRRRSTGRRSD